MKLFNSRINKTRRQSLRNNMTPQEIKLWSRIRCDQLGYRFRRQYGIGKYIADFFCPQKQIVVEVDGSGHFEDKTADSDVRRDTFLNSIGCKVLRFTNADINGNIDGVVLKILELIHTSPQSPSLREGVGTRKRGFSLLETVFYVSILAVLMLIITESFISMAVSYRRLKVAGQIEVSAAVSLERMVREIRAADSIDALSILNTSPGKLVLNTAAAGGGTQQIEFSLQNGKLSLVADGAVVGPLTSAGVAVDAILFRKINNGKAGGVKIEMELAAGSGTVYKSSLFFASAIIRGGE